MTVEERAKGIMQERAARGLHLRVTNIPGRTTPFDCYAATSAECDKWEAGYRAKGFTVERSKARQ